MTHYHILPEAQRTLWENLASCKDLGFVLYGGTALALQLGHRSSVDFDFFSDEPLEQAKETAILQALPFLRQARLIQSSPDTRTYLTEQGVYISFFGNISFGRVGEPVLTDDGVLQLASLDDLMGTKLAVILKRVEVKDYQDVAALLRSGMSLERGLACAQALYENFFPASDCIRALTYFEGNNLASLSWEEREILLTASKRLDFNLIQQVPILSNQLSPVCPAGLKTVKTEFDYDEKDV